MTTSTISTIVSLRHQLETAEANLLIIQERRAEYVLGEEVPLMLVKNERQLTQQINSLHAELRATEDRQLQAVTMRCRAGSKTMLAKMGADLLAQKAGEKLAARLLINLEKFRTMRADDPVERISVVTILNKLAVRACAMPFHQLCDLPEDVWLSPLTTNQSRHPLADTALEQTQTHRVQRGIDALVQLMQDPAVREIVAVFHTDFEAARERVGTLIFFKDLHDQLHTLQYQCYNLIVRDARSFPENDLVRDGLSDYQMTMHEIVRTLRDISARTAVNTLELSWIGDLEDAADSFRKALETTDSYLLNRTIRLTDRVLTTQPIYINANLIATARTLPLPILVATLRRLRERLVKLELDATKMAQFESGVDALSTLSQQLNELLHEHDSWQDIERELRRIDASLRLDTTELEMFWNDLKQKVEALCDISIEEWALLLKKEGALLHMLLAVHEPMHVREAFWRYRRRAGDRFFRVDTELKRLCDRLGQFGDPFAALLSMTELSHAVS